MGRRLGVYMLGIAIGLMVLGSVHRCKRAAGPNTTPTTPTSPPIAAPADAASSAAPG